MEAGQARADTDPAAGGVEAGPPGLPARARAQPTGARALLAALRRATTELGSMSCSSSPAALRASAQAAIVTTSVIVTTMLWTGPGPLRATGHDLLLPLDAAWRVTRGQVPHNDFYSPLGPVFTYWAALWMLLLGPVASVVHYGLVGQGVLLAAAAFQVGRDRLTALGNWAFSAVILLTAAAPYPVGWQPEVLDTAMAYNRLAFSIVMILAVEAGLPSTRAGAGPGRDALLAGALLGVLPLLKLNFAVVGAGAQLLVLLYPGQPLPLRRRLARLAVGAALPASLIFVVLGVEWRRFVGDMRLVHAVFEDSRPATGGALAVLVRALGPEIWAHVLPAAAIVALVAALGSRANTRRAGALALVTGYLLASDLVLGLSNTQLPSLTLLPLVPLFALETVRRAAWLPSTSEARASAVGRWLRTGAACSALTLGALPWLLRAGLGPLRGLRESVAYAVQPLDRWYTLAGRGFERGVPFTRADDYPIAQAAGLTLLQRHLRPGDKLVTIDFSNPFNLTLGLEPPRGDALWWQNGKTFSYHAYLPARRVFAEADWIIVASRWRDEVMPLYRGHVDAHYVEVFADEWWSLYRRRGASES